ncbi:hypothetical protein OG592_40995 (plasmid) [Streptomyces avidinii]|uniref:hypothetical protein n=1 Tax=Streptomyces avidinii TaxID=1895 RepID=UPI002F90AD23|nr:hypothetical protein OG592_40995 [Streptomyces avidinii]
MHTTLQECQDALDAARAQARGLTHTLAATLALMYPHAAYLVLRRDPRSGELHLDSLRTAGGGTLCSFGELDLLPELTDPVLRMAWGQTDLRDPQALLQLLRELDRLGPRSEGSPTPRRNRPTRTRAPRRCCASWSTSTRPSRRATTGK